ncbi:MAG: S1 RNA-binding domain-containing protein [Eubacteriales bacterium]|nr:S1 RNA-binding domain-containing protein [Eubacteriales bacterium]
MLLKKNYPPEGSSRTPPSREELLAAVTDGSILESVAVRCDADHNLHVTLGDVHGVIPREECALGIDTGKTREIAILSRVGKPVCFKVLSIQGTQAILSRRAAQQEALDVFLSTLAPGDIIPARVTHMEPFGAFVDIGCGVVSFIGIENISVSRISHPSERFAPGQLIRAAVLSIEPALERITLTHRELLGTWEENASQFAVGETVCGIVRSTEDYGVFVELTANLSGLAERRFPVSSGQTVSCYIKSILPERMKIKLNLIDLLGDLDPPPIRYFVEEDHMDAWHYSPAACLTRHIATDFSAPHRFGTQD